MPLLLLLLRVATCIVLLISFSGCTPPSARIALTASGYPEGVFQDQSIDEVRNDLIAGCDMNGIAVLEASDNSVLCRTTMSGSDAMLAQMMIGNSYSTTPSRFVRFTLYERGDNVRVSARQWIETQMAFGQTNRMELNQNKHFNEMQNFLYSLGASPQNQGNSASSLTSMGEINLLEERDQQPDR